MCWMLLRFSASCAVSEVGRKKTRGRPGKGKLFRLHLGEALPNEQRDSPGSFHAHGSFQPG